MSLFSAPKQEVVKEDPAVTAARQRQQVQADAALTQGIQDNLRTTMQSRLQRFGLAPVPGSSPSVTSGFLSPV